MSPSPTLCNFVIIVVNRIILLYFLSLVESCSNFLLLVFAVYFSQRFSCGNVQEGANLRKNIQESTECIIGAIGVWNMLLKWKILLKIFFCIKDGFDDEKAKKLSRIYVSSLCGFKNFTEAEIY